MNLFKSNAFLRVHFLRVVFVAVALFCINSSAIEEPPATQPSVSPSPSPPTSFEQLFKTGVQSYQKKDYEQARESFAKSIEKDPNNLSALTNLALAEFQLGKKGYAVALLRKATNLDPDFSVPSAALKFILPQLDVKEIPHEIQLWENLRGQFLAPVPLTAYLILTALLLFTAGWTLLNYIGARKRALKEDALLPSFPSVGFILSLASIATLSLAMLKVYDFQVPRATVIAEKISVLSAPDDKAPALFELFGGLEVIILSTNQDWVQVNYPGALSGWLPKSAVLHTSGKTPW